VAIDPVSATGARPMSRYEELEGLQAEIERLQDQLDALSAEREVADQAHRRVTLELDLQGARWREAEERRLLAEQALVATGAEVERLQKEVDRAEKALRARLGSLYRVGRNGHLRMLLSISSQDGLLPGARTLRYLATRDANDLAQFRDSQEKLKQELETLETQRAERRRWEKLEAERWARLESLQKEAGRQLAGLERRREAARSEQSALVARAERLDDLLDYLAGPPGAASEADPMGDFEGTLDPPVSGRIAQGFGPVLDPRYGTSVPHDGIEYEVGERVAVSAIYPGEVLFAASLEGYGLTVILRHPGKVFSLYAGLDELRVERGGVVSLETQVGLASGQIYFEIRVGNRPVDPLPWFR